MDFINHQFICLLGNKLVLYRDISYSDFPGGITLNLAVADSAGKIFSRSFVIFVQDINEPPGEITWHIEQQCLTGKIKYFNIYCTCTIVQAVDLGMYHYTARGSRKF